MATWTNENRTLPTDPFKLKIDGTYFLKIDSTFMLEIQASSGEWSNLQKSS